MDDQMNDEELSSEDIIKLELNQALSQEEDEEPVAPSEESDELGSEDGLGHVPAKEFLESDK